MSGIWSYIALFGGGALLVAFGVVRTIIAVKDKKASKAAAEAERAKTQLEAVKNAEKAKGEMFSALGSIQSAAATEKAPEEKSLETEKREGIAYSSDRLSEALRAAVNEALRSTASMSFGDDDEK